MGGHDTLYRQDPGFYHSLPNYNETARDEKGHAIAPAPDIFSLLSFAGSAVLSSTVLATAIKAWLQSRRVKITIETSENNKTVTFEGPNLKDSVPDIQAIIKTFESSDGTTQHLYLIAERMDASMLTADQYKMLHGKL